EPGIQQLPVPTEPQLHSGKPNGKPISHYESVEKLGGNGIGVADVEVKYGFDGVGEPSMERVAASKQNRWLPAFAVGVLLIAFAWFAYFHFQPAREPQVFRLRID